MPVEICVDSVESALNAAEGGAVRVELCSALALGGLTPSGGLARRVLDAVGDCIEVYCMVRPREGDFLYSDSEFDVMILDVTALKALPIHGLVTGILTADGEVDEARMKRLIAAASPLPVTFHRAFDMTANPEKALQQLVSLDITRVLTSGTYSSALAGAHVLNSLHALHLPINIMAGAGVSPSTLPELLQVCPWLTEVHASARSTRHSTMRYINPNTLSMGSSLSSTPQYHLESDLRFANRLIVSELVQLIETKEKQFIL